MSLGLGFSPLRFQQFRTLRLPPIALKSHEIGHVICRCFCWLDTVFVRKRGFQNFFKIYFIVGRDQSQQTLSELGISLSRHILLARNYLGTFLDPCASDDVACMLYSSTLNA